MPSRHHGGLGSIARAGHAGLRVSSPASLLLVVLGDHRVAEAQKAGGVVAGAAEVEASPASPGRDESQRGISAKGVHMGGGFAPM